MNDVAVQTLKVVDALDLDEELRSLLRPGEMLSDAQGRLHRLPRYFYEIPTRETAVAVRLTPHFGLNELLLTDLKEASRLQKFPRYIPCAVRLLAFYLQRFREAAGASVHVAVNGGYRSPAHKLAEHASSHMWGTAADIYRIGTTILRTKETIEKYNALAEDVSDDISVLPYGHTLGTQADDHVHFDLGYVTLVPRGISEDQAEVPQVTKPRFAYEDRRERDRRTPGVPEA
jgi:hypothetical protein